MKRAINGSQKYILMKGKYSHFWNWFEKNRIRFEENEISSSAVDEIDKEINKIGEFAWEIGPGQREKFSLTISPGGDPSLLSITRTIISQAPKLSNWEFYPAMPEKKWENYFEVDVSNKKIGIDISHWEYILFRHTNNVFDIQIKANNLPNKITIKPNELQGIAEMVLQSLVGEERRLTAINELEVVSVFEDKFRDSGSSLLSLKKHLDELLR